MSMSRLDDGGSGRREAAATGKSGVRRKETQEQEAPGIGPQTDSTGPYKDPKIVRDFSGPSDKPRMTMFVRRRAHGYTIIPFSTH